MKEGLKEILIHPLPILSVTDHHMRTKQDRVVGIILGTIEDKVINITNSYAVPFEEKNDSLWYLDTTYLINMYDLFRRINMSEKILGWYHSGGSIYKNDLNISKSLEQFVESPLLMVVDIEINNAVPVKLLRYKNNELSYEKFELFNDDPEQVCMDHMLRVLRVDQCTAQVMVNDSLRSYRDSLERIESYLDDVIHGRIRKNFKILNILQECLLERPDISCSEEKRALECYAVELTKAIIDLNELEHNRNENKIKSK